MIALTLALTVLTQQPPQPDSQEAQAAKLQEERALAEDPRTRRAYFSRDWMIGVAGDEVVLRSDLDALIFRNPEMRNRWQNADGPGRQALYQEALGQRLETLLRVQAGMDLGFDPTIVNKQTAIMFEDRVKSLGGHRATSKALQADQLTPAQFHSHLRDQLLAMTWYQVQIGRTPGRTGRVFVDRHVRPGWIKSAYHSFLNSPSVEEQALVGKKEQSYRLQGLRVPVDPESSPADAEALALELRRMYRGGEVDFDFLVRTYADPASQEKLGRIPPLSAARVAQMGQVFHGPAGLALNELIESGEIDGTTPPLFREAPDCWYIYRLEEIDPGHEAQPLSAPEVQHALRDFLLKTQDDGREQTAFSRVLSDSFVYPSQFGPFLAERNRRGQ